MTTKHPNSYGTYYTDEDMARLLGISIGRLRNKLTAGNPLPPRIQPPGCRNRLWPREAVHTWLEQFMVSSAAGRPDQQRFGRSHLRHRSGR